MSEKARLAWQCRRGMLELDWLLQRFLDQQYEQQSPALQKRFRELLQEPDPQLFHWLMNAADDVPENYQELVDLIRCSC